MGLRGEAAIVGYVELPPERMNKAGIAPFTLEQWAELGSAALDDAGLSGELVDGIVTAVERAQASLAAGCKRLVFSSTCATYGDHDGVLLDETTVQRPLNAYGGSKLAIEQILNDFGASDGLETVIFRYFNVAGADPDADEGQGQDVGIHRPALGR